ncbi:COG1470 family protein [Sinomicrobium soli]|uniref:COG1470 family protein n=1 Tax=Sinomicrobium sp. N-1-3-6 TaxID=2219864 RepID=UPI0011BE27A1|nr:hypothetical protein [Sinomicrobium sp. N-1-3-6]
MIFILGVLCSGLCSYAQDAHGILMEAERAPDTGKGDIIDVTVLLHNTTTSDFNGAVKIEVPEGFRNISGNLPDVSVKAGEKRYFPVKIHAGGTARAGTVQIVFFLLDSDGKLVAKDDIQQAVEERNMLRLSAQTPEIYNNTPGDSVSVEVTVSNQGNTGQQVNVVFSIPELMGEDNFFEKTGVVGVLRDTIFSFSFIPDRTLLSKPRFTVNVSGMRGGEKELFGHLSVTVTNTASNRWYNAGDAGNFETFTGYNNLTLSYRNSGYNREMYQLMGNGSVDLPAGFLSFRGNIYQGGGQRDPVVTGTSVSYRLNRSEIKAGNISRPLELYMFGRGAEFSLKDSSNNDVFQAGFIDQNFNLIEQHAFLREGYGVYARGVLGSSGPLKRLSATYIFKEDRLEEARHNVLGTEMVRIPGKGWTSTFRVFGAMSQYYEADKDKPSGAVETQYTGSIGNIRLSGNYFYSTPYFPGNRRGMLMLQQHISGRLTGEKVFSANAYVSNYFPKSYTYGMNVFSNNARFDAGIRFPANTQGLGFGISYQYQSESSNGYNALFGIGDPDQKLRMDVHRLVESLNWVSVNGKHSVVMGAETGLANYPDKDALKAQLKFSGIYNYQGVSFNASYQYGGYFLSEHASTAFYDDDRNFRRMILSLVAGKNLFEDRLSLRSGLGYIDDFRTGKTPSAFLNLNYAPRPAYSLYLNSSWFRYDTGMMPLMAGNDNMLTIEGGVVLHLERRKPSPYKKSSVVVFVYYDKNVNNVFDEGDEVAENYMLSLGKTSFLTDKEGRIYYRKVPYGAITVVPVTSQGWFSPQKVVEVNEHYTYTEVPLHRNGTVAGRIRYDLDARTAVDFRLRGQGITFDIYRGDRYIQRVATDESGSFMAFLPTGNYRVKLIGNSLPANTSCEEMVRDFEVKAGEITSLPVFGIAVRQKQVRVKRFGE